MPQIEASFKERRRISLHRPRLLASFRRAIRSLLADLLAGRAKRRDVARLAHRLYVLGLGVDEPPPSLHAFERKIYGKHADPVIAALIPKPDPASRKDAIGRRAADIIASPRLKVSPPIRKRLNRRLVLEAFETALRALLEEKSREKIRPRTVAVRAHVLYRERQGIEGGSTVEAFRQLAVGRRAYPEVVALLGSWGIRPPARARIDRERLRAVFREAVQRFESNVIRGRARPIQIARRAYDLYTRTAENASPRPSQRTFQRLLYGKAADPEIAEIIRSAVKGPG